MLAIIFCQKDPTTRLEPSVAYLANSVHTQYLYYIVQLWDQSSLRMEERTSYELLTSK